MTTNPLQEALMLCATIKSAWMERPENQRPPVWDRPASDTWWSRWFTSAECERCNTAIQAAIEEQDDARTHAHPAAE